MRWLFFSLLLANAIAWYWFSMSAEQRQVQQAVRSSQNGIDANTGDSLVLLSELAERSDSSINSPEVPIETALETQPAILPSEVLQQAGENSVEVRSPDSQEELAVAVVEKRADLTPAEGVVETGENLAEMNSSDNQHEAAVPVVEKQPSFRSMEAVVEVDVDAVEVPESGAEKGVAAPAVEKQADLTSAEAPIEDIVNSVEVTDPGAPEEGAVPVVDQQVDLAPAETVETAENMTELPDSSHPEELLEDAVEGQSVPLPQEVLAAAGENLTAEPGSSLPEALAAAEVKSDEVPDPDSSEEAVVPVVEKQTDLGRTETVVEVGSTSIEVAGSSDSEELAETAVESRSESLPEELLADTGENSAEFQSQACSLVGPFDDENAAQDILARLVALNTEAQVVSKDILRDEDYWLILPSASNSEATRLLQGLQAENIDSFIILEGEHQNSITLGVFSEKANAEEYQKRIASFGYSANLHVIPRMSRQYWLEFPERDIELISDEFWQDMKRLANRSEVEVLGLECGQPIDSESL